MRLGIDFGTTRTVVAACDRGNYPVIGFQDGRGDAVEWFPSVVAARGGELRFGLDALEAGEGFTVLRSFKRLLHAATPETPVTIGDTTVPLADLLSGYLGALRRALVERSNLPAKLAAADLLDVVVAVPANARGAQRFLTLEAFRAAGFAVQAIMNEPSAAGYEYTHRHRNTLSAKREHVVVYDLGGGTFDASLVRMAGAQHDVLATSGIGRLGGDDFDALLAGMVAGDRAPSAELVERCRLAKESLNPSSRKIVVEGDEGEVTIAVADYYAACAPLIERTIAAMVPVLEASGDGLAGIYVVGGASALPAVGRALRDRFGRRVHKSPYSFAAVAIGLAIAADEDSPLRLSDRFSRCFGVFREADGGKDISFDPIFDARAPLPAAGDERPALERVYRAAHNVGHFRFVECEAVTVDGAPEGDITPSGEILFAFDEALRGREADLVKVERRGAGPLVRERYEIDPGGMVRVTITDLESGYAREVALGPTLGG